eukprot:scaffold12183_cov68-Phaeocystis_antarctica.AAC.2
MPHCNVGAENAHAHLAARQPSIRADVGCIVERRSRALGGAYGMALHGHPAPTPSAEAVSRSSTLPNRDS